MELIDRKALVDRMLLTGHVEAETVFYDIYAVPIIAAEPVVHAYWKPFGIDAKQCSNCGAVECPETPYCKMCGSKMDC